VARNLKLTAFNNRLVKTDEFNTSAGDGDLITVNFTWKLRTKITQEKNHARIEHPTQGRNTNDAHESIESQTLDGQDSAATIRLHATPSEEDNSSDYPPKFACSIDCLLTTS
jgi:hypothetical protein